MKSSHDAGRREFLARTAVLAAAVALAPRRALAGEAPAARQKVIAFSKPFRSLSARATADLVAEVGWDGIELPVRARDAQFTPDKVDEELPKFVEALRAVGREVSIITSDITAVTPQAEKTLRAMQKLGIKRYRLGFYTYAKDKPLPEQLKEIAPKLRDIAALNKELGLQAGFQNHSGAGYVGAPLWDVWTMIRDLDPAQIGYCYDIGHATVEGGLSWPTNFRLVEPWLTAVFVKDFRWEKTAKGWRTVWCPLGEGMVDRKFFGMLKATAYRGPISQHHEYDIGDEKSAMAFYKRDLATLREWLVA